MNITIFFVFFVCRLFSLEGSSGDTTKVCQVNTCTMDNEEMETEIEKEGTCKSPLSTASEDMQTESPALNTCGDQELPKLELTQDSTDAEAEGIGTPTKRQKMIGGDLIGGDQGDDNLTSASEKKSEPSGDVEMVNVANSEPNSQGREDMDLAEQGQGEAAKGGGGGGGEGGMGAVPGGGEVGGTQGEQEVQRKAEVSIAQEEGREEQETQVKEGNETQVKEGNMGEVSEEGGGGGLEEEAAGKQEEEGGEVKGKEVGMDTEGGTEDGGGDEKKEVKKKQRKEIKKKSTNVEKKEKIVARKEDRRNDSEEEEEEEEDTKFPNTLEGFNYKFDDKGQLRHIVNSEPYVFEVKKGNRRYNQRHYDALGEVITDEVYKLLVERAQLEKVHLPTDAGEDEARSFFFMSKGALENPEKLLILIHGSGAVRAGQWARSLIINNDIESGTQLPYIERGEKEGYSVMVLNTNHNYATEGGRMKPIRDNGTPQQHARYVWKHFVQKASAKRIDIVAHSFGGVVTVDLVCQFSDDFLERVGKIAFTDSVHSLSSSSLTRRNAKWLCKNARNWVSSSDELDTRQMSYFFDRDIPRVSAGTPKHVETSWKSFESVFRFLTDKEEPTQKLKRSPKKKADSTPKKEGHMSKEKAEEGSKKTEKAADISKGAEDTLTKSSEDSDVEAQT